jgi:hypothetical protein
MSLAPDGVSIEDVRVSARPGRAIDPPPPEIFGDPVAVAPMVDCLVHHAEVIVLKGESYRRRGRKTEVLTGAMSGGL